MLSDRTRELAQAPNFAALTTMLPDGTPQTHLMWVDADDRHVLVNTEVHRRKYRNMMANPKATVLIMARDDPWSYVEVRGTVVGSLTGPDARAHIDRLSEKYLGRPYANPIRSERVIVKIRPDREVPFPPE